MIGCLELTHPEQLDEYRLIWRDLFQRTRGASYTHSFEWMSGYAHRFAGSQKLRVLIASAGNRTMGILPLVVRRESGVGGKRILGFPRDAWGAFCGPVGPNPAGTLMLAMRHIRESRRGWDVLDLAGIPETLDRGRTRNALRLAGFRCHEEPGTALPSIDLNAPWLEYRAGLDAGSRELLATAPARLEAEGRVKFVRYRPEGSLLGETERRWRHFSDFERLLRVASPAPAALPDSQRRAGAVFLRDLYTTAIDAGTADLSLLYVGEQPVAAAFGLVTGGRVELLELVALPSQNRLATAALLRELLLDSRQREDGVLRLPLCSSAFLNTFASMHEPTTHLRCEHPAFLRGRWNSLAAWVGRSLHPRTAGTPGAPAVPARRVSEPSRGEPVECPSPHAAFPRLAAATADSPYRRR